MSVTLDPLKTFLQFEYVQCTEFTTNSILNGASNVISDGNSGWTKL